MKKETKSAVTVAAESKFAVGARATIDNLTRIIRECNIKDLKVTTEVYEPDLFLAFLTRHFEG